MEAKRRVRRIEGTKCGGSGMAGARAEGVVRTDAGGDQRSIDTKVVGGTRTKDGKALGNAKGSSGLESSRVRGSED